MSYDELELDTLGDRKTALFVIISDTDGWWRCGAYRHYADPSAVRFVLIPFNLSAWEGVKNTLSLNFSEK